VRTLGVDTSGISYSARIDIKTITVSLFGRFYMTLILVAGSDLVYASSIDRNSICTNLKHYQRSDPLP